MKSSLPFSFNSNQPCHYDTLGVTEDATTDEIKARFRQLSMETHPDVAGSNEVNTNRFKRISQAASVLTNPSKRRTYDAERAESGSNPFVEHLRRRKARSQTDAFGRRASSSSFERDAGHIFLSNILRPRNLILGPLAVLVAVSTINYITGPQQEQQSKTGERYHAQDHQHEMVQAWKNPATGYWEQPAPWDPVYRRLQPTLHHVPRHQVRRRVQQ